METISPQTFYYTKVKVGPTRFLDLSGWGSFQSSKRRFAPNNFGPYTFWYQNVLAFDFFWIFGWAGRPEEMGAYGTLEEGIRGGGRREEMGEEGRGGEGRVQ